MTTPAATDRSEFVPVEIRPWQPGDEGGVLACHNAVFAAPPRGTAPRTMAHWRWKYLANPTGRMLQMLAVHPLAGVVGVYATVPVRVTFAGTRTLASQGVDLCVLPDWLRVGGAHGLFPHLGRAWHARWLGRADDQVRFLYGLPFESWRSGWAHLGWQTVRDWDITFRDLPAGSPARPVPSELAVRVVERFDGAADELFARLEPGFGLTTVRDSAYLNWRYADHPERCYVAFECRERASGRLRGLCVYGTGDVGRLHTSYLLDWLVPADDVDTTTALLAAVEQRTREDGTGMLCSVWNPMDPRFLVLQHHGYRVRGTPWFLAVAAAGDDSTFFRERWYFTLGDSDLV